MPIKAVILDMDGVIVDSEHLSRQILTDHLIEMGLPMTEADFAEFVGLGGKEIALRLEKKYDLPITTKVFLREQKDRLAYLYQNNPNLCLVPGVMDFLGRMKTANIPLAIASSSMSRYVMTVLNRFGLMPYFQVAVGGDMVDHAKPAPDVYLLAAKLMGIAPEEAIGIEDSVNGIRAALAAGVPVVGFNGSSIQQNTAAALCSVSHFDQLTLDFLIDQTRPIQ